jgi:hypothetical protein
MGWTDVLQLRLGRQLGEGEDHVRELRLHLPAGGGDGQAGHPVDEGVIMNNKDKRNTLLAPNSALPNMNNSAQKTCPPPPLQV